MYLVHRNEMHFQIFTTHFSSEFDLTDQSIASTKTKYRTRAIIGRSRFEAALVYKPRILGLKNEEFPFLVHKLSVI